VKSQETKEDRKPEHSALLNNIKRKRKIKEQKRTTGFGSGKNLIGDLQL
jgi:hypothetical protein